MRILVVEDNIVLAETIKEELCSNSNLDVSILNTGEDALYDIERSIYDIIILDIMLPELSGIDILKSLREKNIFIDAIMITAANSTDEIKKAFAYGVVDYLVKPFEFERFKEAINKYRVKNKLLLNDEVLTQKDIDTLLMNSSLESQVKLPKGLNEKTLDRVIKFLNENSNEVWTLREIAYEIKISNVTIKKYMDYLESIGKVNSEMTFGNVGRPEYKYFVKK